MVLERAVGQLFLLVAGLRELPGGVLALVDADDYFYKVRWVLRSREWPFAMDPGLPRRICFMLFLIIFLLGTILE